RPVGGEHEQTERSVGPGDQQVDACVIEPSKPRSNLRRPVWTVVERARPEADDQAGREDDRGEPRPAGLRRQDERQRERERRVETKLVQNPTQSWLARDRRLQPHHSESKANRGSAYATIRQSARDEGDADAQCPDKTRGAQGRRQAELLALFRQRQPLTKPVGRKDAGSPPVTKEMPTPSAVASVPARERPTPARAVP